MRQKFDVGDLVKITLSKEGDKDRGIILQTKLINEHIEKQDYKFWHTDEYRCRIRFLSTGESSWVRAKWLKHISKKS